MGVEFWEHVADIIYPALWGLTAWWIVLISLTLEPSRDRALLLSGLSCIMLVMVLLTISTGEARTNGLSLTETTPYIRALFSLCFPIFLTLSLRWAKATLSVDPQGLVRMWGEVIRRIWHIGYRHTH